MKKFLYLCLMMTLSMNLMAQIDLNDQNWRGSLVENFDEDNSYWQWHTDNFSNSDYTWKAFIGSRIDNENLHHLYQYNNARYDSINGAMLLVSEYDTAGLIPQYQFALPTNGSSYNSIYIDNKFYFSGAIQYVKNIWFPEKGKFKYGYFEIRCKMPKHQGAHPAFWLHGACDTIDPYYEEIDIIEFSWSSGSPNANWLPVINPNATHPGDPRFYSTAIGHNLHGHNINFETDVYAMVYPHIPDDQNDISGWHTYACEWMPDHVYWYLDGELKNSYYDQTHIPRHHLSIKTNYAIDDYATFEIESLDNRTRREPVWQGTDTLTIDYIKVYQLEWDCDTDEVIASQNDLQQFPFAVKKSITIAPINEDVIVRDTDKVTLRATDCFEISGSFEVLQGGEFTMIMQKCPE